MQRGEDEDVKRRMHQVQELWGRLNSVVLGYDCRECLKRKKEEVHGNVWDI